MSTAAALRTLEGDRTRMLEQVRAWAAINSYSYSVDGLGRMADVLAEELRLFGEPVRRQVLEPERVISVAGTVESRPLGDCLSVVRRPKAPIQVLLAIHYDTVFPAAQSFAVGSPHDGHLTGPGVIDAKGGIAILLAALRAFEQFEQCERLGWEVLLNPDEEVGSPGSLRELRARAATAQLGLLFEPALPDGSIVGGRGGSGSVSIVVRGRSAHVGRDYTRGRSAMHTAAEYIGRALGLARHGDFTFNVGRIDGGGPANTVADLAVVRANLRVADLPAIQTALSGLTSLAAAMSGDGLSLEVHGGFSSPPKQLLPGNQEVLDIVLDCARVDGLEPPVRSTGGVCDGNKLAAAGLPNVDTLGACGWGAHTNEETLIIDSLFERARLTLRVLIGLAEGRYAPPSRLPIVATDEPT